MAVCIKMGYQARNGCEECSQCDIHCRLDLLSKETPVNACVVGRLIQQVGFPKGVVNILPGKRDSGEALCGHAGVLLSGVRRSVPSAIGLMEPADSHVAPAAL